MPHLPQSIKTATQRINTYVQHQKAKLNAAKPTDATVEQKDFDLGALGDWAKDLKLTGSGRYKTVYVCQDGRGTEFVTTNKKSLITGGLLAYVKRSQTLDPKETNRRLKETLESPRVRQLVTGNPELQGHLDVLLGALDKNTASFGIDTGRQKAIIALGAAYKQAGADDRDAEYEALVRTMDSFDLTSSDPSR